MRAGSTLRRGRLLRAGRFSFSSLSDITIVSTTRVEELVAVVRRIASESESKVVDVALLDVDISLSCSV